MIKCIYIHIPFCKEKCKYCSFCSFGVFHSVDNSLDNSLKANSTALNLKKKRIDKLKEDYLFALISEINYFYKPLQNTQSAPLSTIYFGGGTPSLLNIGDIEKILKCFNFDKTTEITLEMNPETVNKTKLLDLKNLGINRLSLGVQSFDNPILKEIGRNHTTKEIYQAVDDIKSAGFDNFSIDLMYGLPNQTLEKWQHTIYKALEFDPTHISLYGLKIEEGSYYFKNPPSKLPDLDYQAVMYNRAAEILKDKYLHYEFSNFAKNENYFSRHNLAYWERKYYWGFGVSSSGFILNKDNMKMRYTNTFNLKKYLQAPLKKEFEILSKREEIEEEIFLGLRKSEGIDFEQINRKYEIDVYGLFKKQFDKFLDYKLLEKTKKGVKLTFKGIMLSNEVLSEFLEIN